MLLDVDRLHTELNSRLADSDAALAARFPGERRGRQPVHTVYLPADRYRAETCSVWGERAVESIDAYPTLFRDLTGSDDDLVARVRNKLAIEPIEDLRIDFEDGYGARADDAEDADASVAAAALAASLRNGSASPFCGIRIKSLEARTRHRSLRTFTGFVSEFVAAGGDLAGFVTTLPKVTSVDQVEAMAYLCGELERALGIAGLRFEIQVETPQSVVGPDGTALVAKMLHAARDRCAGLHYGTYDYSAFCGIAAEYQSMAHPVADHAKLVMQAAAAGTGVRLSDGSTNILPIGDVDAVRAGWDLHLRLVRRSLQRGYYQGWDLHPAQLPTRYAATFGFYRQGLDRANGRLCAYFAGTDSAIIDEPATVRALANFVLRALNCGATTTREIEEAAGLSPARLGELALTGP